MPEPSAFEVELAIEELKRHKSPGIDRIQAEWIKAGSRIIYYEIYKLNDSIWNKEEFPEEWRKSIIYLSIIMVIKQIALIIDTYHCCQTHKTLYPTSCCQG